jgi:hypothetical protein
MEPREPILQLLSRITVLERVITKIIVADCIEKGLKPKDLLVEAERMKVSMEEITTGEASAFLNAAIDNLFNGFASNLGKNL